MKSLLYTAELDLAEPDMAPFLDWYAGRHAPDLYPIGFRSCACYRTDDPAMNLFDIYEISGHDIFTGAAYARLKRRDPYAAGIEGRRRNKAHTIYEQFEAFAGSVAEDPSLDEDWIVTLRFDAADDPAALSARLGGVVKNALARGCSRARLGVRTTDHPMYTTTRPRYMLLLEAERQPEPAIATALREHLTGFASNVIGFTGHRLYPWPTIPRS
jgi:hypothetical protein